MSKKNKIKNGFTMIELIVVVTIMALLTVIAVVSYSTTNKKSRDSKRMADLEKVRVALELYRQTEGYYPVADAGGSVALTGYLQEWPKDPKNYLYYYVRGAGTSYTYTLDGQMEDVGNTNITDGGNNCGGKCNYRLISP